MFKVSEKQLFLTSVSVLLKSKAYHGIFNILRFSLKADEVSDLKRIFIVAEEQVRKGIAKEPRIAGLHSILGYIFLHRGNHGQAEREFKTALELDSKNEIAQVYLLMKEKEGWEELVTLSFLEEEAKPGRASGR